MRRVNIEAAFLGEGGESDTGDEEGLALAVRGGEVVLVLPAGTPEHRAVHAASTLRGSLRLKANLQALANELGPREICVEGVSCLGQCDYAPNVVAVNDHVYRNVSEADLRTRIEAALARKPLPHQHADRGPLGWRIDVYDGQPRYDAVRKLLETHDAVGRLVTATDPTEASQELCRRVPQERQASSARN